MPCLVSGVHINAKLCVSICMISYTFYLQKNCVLQPLYFINVEYLKFFYAGDTLWSYNKRGVEV